MQKITPFLWFETEAAAAADFYTSIFPNSRVKTKNILKDTPSGDVETVAIELNGYEIAMMSAGPLFKFNPTVSFMVNFDPSVDEDARAQLDKIWEHLVDGGTALMELGEYPFSPRYGWVQDKYGVSWQLILTDPSGEPRPFIIPSLMFVGNVLGKAEEAADFYLSVFHDTKKGMVAKYPAGMEPDQEGTTMFADFMIENQWFAVMDSARMHDFNFQQAISFIINCENNQDEIDYYWNKLSAVPEAEQCGWLQDKFGIPWQVTPTILDKLLADPDPAKAERVKNAMLQMKKIDIAILKKAGNVQ